MERIDLPDAVERYLAGESAKDIAKSHGVSDTPVIRQLKAAGVYRDVGDAQRRRFGTPEIDGAALVARYVGGESEKALSISVGCSRGVIRRILLEHGVEPRGRSESMCLRMSQTTSEQRLSLTQAAHAAVRGVPHSEEHRVKVAMSREANGTQISPLEVEFAERLRVFGIDPIPQKAVGRYNVDLALAESSVSVEIFGGHWHGSGRHGRRYRDRMDYLLDRGWLPVVIWVVLPQFALTDAAVEYVVARHEERRRNKSVAREEHVIRGDGEGGPISECYPSCVPSVERPKPGRHAARHDSRTG